MYILAEDRCACVLNELERRKMPVVGYALLLLKGQPTGVGFKKQEVPGGWGIIIRGLFSC